LERAKPGESSFNDGDIFMEPRGIELIARYKSNYSIPAEAEVTEQMILAHWELEKQLTRELLESTPENRWEVFKQCYTCLYSELEWLNRLIGKSDTVLSTDRYKTLEKTIGSPPQRIYEIGSGKGAMIAYLAERGFECKGTEISQERGEKHLTESHPNLSWGISDGIHLDRFELPGTYDVVVSEQVVEHLHPKDLDAHLRGVYNLLVKKGRYIFNTPHCYTGPHDISRVFKCDKPKGMHLKEYMYRELTEAVRNAGFSSVYYVIPANVRKSLSYIGARKQEHIMACGIFYLSLMLVMEKILSVIYDPQLRHFCAKALKKFLVFRDNIFLVAQK
jgi:cyclopropane fatty-acyl-phospholipid synthase-like methyltransferase